ncbi:MAG: biotin/lipoyl-binding protein [Prevotella sp.]|nr:biotin/lipoyl-binding protein [Prevotella sp.]
MKTYKYKVKGVDYEVEIAQVEGKIAKVNVNGIPFEIEMQKPINAAKHPTLAAARAQSPVAAPVASPSAATAPAAKPAPQPVAQPAAPAGAGNALKAPLPGTVTEVKVQVGQQVNVGDTVLVLEAMKMQNNIESEYAGQVTSVLVKQGDTVMEGAVMLTIA